MSKDQNPGLIPKIILQTFGAKFMPFLKYFKGSSGKKFFTFFYLLFYELLYINLFRGHWFQNISKGLCTTILVDFPQNISNDLLTINWGFFLYIYERSVVKNSFSNFLNKILKLNTNFLMTLFPQKVDSQLIKKNVSLYFLRIF